MSVIPKLTPEAARDNAIAIDALVGECPYPYIVAWGKLLGFTPETVQASVQKAIASGAPSDAIHTEAGRWAVLGEIVNEVNRARVVEVAQRRLVDVW